MVRQSVGNVLQGSGYSVLLAESGQKGIELAQNHQIDLIVCDVVMEHLDGFAVIDRLRMDPATSAIPFIFMTGVTDAEIRQKGMALGADTVLIKPFALSELLATVEARLSKHKEMLAQVRIPKASERSPLSADLPKKVRTPLSTIVGLAEIVGDEENSLPAAEIARLGKLICRAGEKLQRVLRNFMVYSRIDSLDPNSEELRELRRGKTTSAADVAKAVSRKKAELYWRMPDLQVDLIDSSVAAGPEALETIIGELIDNAFKFSQAGTQVSVTLSANGGRFGLSIRDHGRGMSKAQIAAIVSPGMRRWELLEQEGDGLGLLLAKRLTEALGGMMEFESANGKGTTVTVTLPLAV
jgi:signal transduction histidine kinase